MAKYSGRGADFWPAAPAEPLADNYDVIRRRRLGGRLPKRAKPVRFGNHSFSDDLVHRLYVATRHPPAFAGRAGILLLKAFVSSRSNSLRF